MKKIFDVKNIVIVLLSVLCIIEFINPKGIMPKRMVQSKPIVDSIPYAVHDTIPFEVYSEIEIPVPIEIHDTIPVPTLIPVDTNLILKDYLAKVEIKERLTLPNKQGTIDLTEVISKNKVIDRTFTTNIKPTIKKDTIYTPEPKKTQFFAGLEGKFDKPNVVQILGAGFVLKDKSDRLYKIDIGVANRVTEGSKGEFTPYIGGGVFWKIKVKQ